MNKPPFGTKSAIFALPDRIKNLADAISRYTNHENIWSDKKITQIIREWATEIICTCDTIDRLIDLKAGKKDV